MHGSHPDPASTAVLASWNRLAPTDPAGTKFTWTASLEALRWSLRADGLPFDTDTVRLALRQAIAPNRIFPWRASVSRDGRIRFEPA